MLLWLLQGALGTAAYMAPEVFSAGNVNETADVYAYGVILWECLTGRQPWAECSNIMQVSCVVLGRHPAVMK